MRENRASHLVGWQTHPTIAPVGVRTHDLPHAVASNMVKVSYAPNHSATGSHFGWLRIKPIVSLWGLFPEGSEGCAVHGVSEKFPLLCGRVFGLWGTELALKSLLKLWHEVWLWHHADINTGIPLFLSAMEPLWLQTDLATHQGVVLLQCALWQEHVCRTFSRATRLNRIRHLRTRLYSRCQNL